MGLLVAGLLLWSHPVLLAWRAGGVVLGLPLAWWYLLLTWAAFIAALWWLMEGGGAARPRRPSPGP